MEPLDHYDIPETIEDDVFPNINDARSNVNDYERTMAAMIYMEELASSNVRQLKIQNAYLIHCDEDIFKTKIMVSGA